MPTFTQMRIKSTHTREKDTHHPLKLGKNVWGRKTLGKMYTDTYICEGILSNFLDNFL